jgi:hypothetical protein
MSKHTPGPWRLDDIGGDDYNAIAGGEDGSIIASTWGGTHPANARLIAAAPELYEIAKRTAAHFEDTDAPLGIAARAALAKVDGESK